MADRPKALQRLAAVQKQMVRLSEWRVAAAERSCRDLAADKDRLQSYVVEEGALGMTLARSALRSLKGLDERLAAAERLRATSKAALEAATRREHVIADVATRAGRDARRVADDRALAATVEIWLATRRASEDSSLP